MEQLERFIRDERGDMAEKALVAVIIVLATIAMWQALGSKIATWFSRVTVN
ncbi:MAG: hypothetical protein JW850_07880 [Thermoflexales bacterium]|nr:hypothetical protein [Thermoflexales bacterium]